MNDDLKAGVYAYYVCNNPDGSKSLCYAFYDGETLSGPVPCTIQDYTAPDMIATPCVLWEPDGRYSAIDVSKIHVFLLVGANELWWITSTNGHTFTLNSKTLTNITTTLNVSALIFNDQMHLYYNNSKTPNQLLYHARSTTDWTFQTVEPVLLDSLPIPLNWGCSAALNGGVPYLVFNNQSDSRVRLIVQPNAGEGPWSEISPSSSTCNHTPNVALLGGLPFVTHHGYDDDSRILSETMDGSGAWTKDTPVPDAWTTNGPGACVWGDRLYCFFQSSDGNGLYVQVYVDGAWLRKAMQVSDVTGVWYGIGAVAVHAGAP